MSLDKSAHSKFLEFHSHPKALSNKDLESLEQLIQEFPYCQSIKMLVLKSAESTNWYNSLLQEASAFSSSRSILYDFIHQPELFVAELETVEHSKDEHENRLSESNDIFGINLDEIVGKEWHKEKTKEHPEETIGESSNIFGIDLSEISSAEFKVEKQVEETEIENPSAFGIDLNQIVGSEFQYEKAVDDPLNLEIEQELETSDKSAHEIPKESIPKESDVQLEEKQDLDLDKEEPESPENKSEEIIEDIQSVTDELETEPLKEDINGEELAKESENSVRQEVEEVVDEEENTSDATTVDINEITTEIESVDAEDLKTIQEEIFSPETPGEEIEVEGRQEQKEVILEAINDKILTEEEVEVDNLSIAESEKIEVLEIESLNEQTETNSKEERVSEKDIQEGTDELESEVRAEVITAESKEEIALQDHIGVEETVDNEIIGDLQKEEEILNTAQHSTDVENIKTNSEEFYSKTENIEESESNGEVEEPLLGEIEKEVLEKNLTEPETIVEESIEQVQEQKEEAVEELAFESPVHSVLVTFAEKEEPKRVEEQNEEITAYNDDTMPYTFLWWLNKTRKEYAESHQPYVKAKSPFIKLDTQKEIEKQEKDDLNHQIAENIFHLRGIEEFTGNSNRNPTVPFEFMRKDFQIIEKFIKEEPQIRPPAPNKIDTENKAKKSSEDSNEVVSETLAKIYVEQMLYHKALDVYKKLSLKFPEKSAYFASQIKYLELKVN